MFAIVGASAVVVLGGAFFAYKKFFDKPPPPPAPVAKKAPANPNPANKAPGTTPGATPSDTLNKIAQTPKAAIDKAQAAIDARRASGQSKVDALAEGSEPPQKTAPAPQKAAPKVATATKTIAPGITATTEIDATAEASPAFRAWVANMKIGAVVWGDAKFTLNGRIVRQGQIVDNALGIKFDSINVEKKQLIFKDPTGATVTRGF